MIAINGLGFDLDSRYGRMMATVLAGIAEFERELIQEQIKSGMAAAKALESVSPRPSGTGAIISV